MYFVTSVIELKVTFKVYCKTENKSLEERSTSLMIVYDLGLRAGIVKFLDMVMLGTKN